MVSSRRENRIHHEDVPNRISRAQPLIAALPKDFARLHVGVHDFCCSISKFLAINLGNGVTKH